MVYLFLANGFEEIEALLPLDLLRRGGVEVTTVAVGGSDFVVGSHGIPVGADLPETLFRDSAPEAVILPGGMPGAKNLDASRTVDAALRVTAANGGLLCAICAAPFVLGKRGYLSGKEAICFPGFEGELTGARISQKRVVRDGNIITAAGMGVAMEFGLEILCALRGKETAEKIRKSILAD
ncbi:MAG: DJ-1/PfpI family protein [Ruminococcaceae bacterium]|nr:DJ-1/PfpI family protein [Oscillospiraceae bacterium]